MTGDNWVATVVSEMNLDNIITKKEQEKIAARLAEIKVVVDN